MLGHLLTLGCRRTAFLFLTYACVSPQLWFSSVVASGKPWGKRRALTLQGDLGAFCPESSLQSLGLRFVSIFCKKPMTTKSWGPGIETHGVRKALRPVPPAWPQLKPSICCTRKSVETSVLTFPIAPHFQHAPALGEYCVHVCINVSSKGVLLHVTD